MNTLSNASVPFADFSPKMQAKHLVTRLVCCKCLLVRALSCVIQPLKEEAGSILALLQDSLSSQPIRVALRPSFTGCTGFPFQRAVGTQSVCVCFRGTSWFCYFLVTFLSCYTSTLRSVRFALPLTARLHSVPYALLFLLLHVYTPFRTLCSSSCCTSTLRSVRFALPLLFFFRPTSSFQRL